MLITRCDKSITGQKVKGTVTDIAKTYSPQPHWGALSSRVNFNPLRSSWWGATGAMFANLHNYSPLSTSLSRNQVKGAAWAEAGTTCDPKGSGSWTGPGGRVGCVVQRRAEISLVI